MRIIRIALLLMTVALVGPSAAGALASGGPANQHSVRLVAAAPADAFTVGGIEFALQRGDNATPINPSNRFAFGTRHVWAFWSWDDARNGSRVNYVLRLNNTDVAWGTIEADKRNGRMEVDLERLDGQYLGLGTYRLYLDAAGGDSGNVRQAEFEIYDPDHHDNHNGNSNHNSNNNNGNNNNSNHNNNNNANNNNGNNNNHNDNGDHGGNNDNG